MTRKNLNEHIFWGLLAVINILLGVVGFCTTNSVVIGVISLVVLAVGFHGTYSILKNLALVYLPVVVETVEEEKTDA